MAGFVDLATYLSQLQVLPEEPSLEPELDDKDEKKDREMRSDLLQCHTQSLTPTSLRIRALHADIIAPILQRS